MNKKLSILLLLLPLAANAASPDLILKDAQEVIISGKIQQERTYKPVKGRVSEVKIITLKPKQFLVIKPGQSFNSILTVVATTPEIEKALSNFYEQDATVNCLISFENKTNPVCNVLSVSRFQNLAQETIPTTNTAGQGGSWFRSAHGLLLRDQLEGCENFKVAGNASLYQTCRTRTLNAHDYLLDRANISKLPLTGWSFCSNQIQYDFPSGAQCLAAVELLCPPDESNEFKDFNQCYKVMTSGAWVSNPTIQRMTFTTPAR